MQSDSDDWMELDGDELARSIVDHCKALDGSDGARRRARWFENWSLYEGKSFGDPTMAGASIDGAADRYNVSRSAVDTGQAEIASRQRPKPMFLTSGADWHTRRRAKRLDRAVEAQLHQRQGARYADAWELTEDVFRDAEVAVGGVVKVVVDYAAERTRLLRVPAYEILVDPLDAENGDPGAYHHVYDMSAMEAIRDFVPTTKRGESQSAEAVELRTKIDHASSDQVVDVMLGPSGISRRAKKLKIYETWILPPSADEPGKHLICCSEGMLLEEDWTWPVPPLAIIVWSREAFGIWGTGLVEAGATQHDMIQELAGNIDRRFRLCAQKRVYYVPGSVDEEAMKSNGDVVFIPVKQGGQMPLEVDTPPVTAAEEQHLQTEMSRYYELQGVSQMSAQARKDPGVDAAVAMQTLNDIKSVRFLPKARAYEMLYVRIGELMARALGELVSEKKGAVAKWPGSKQLEEIDISKAWLDDTLYTVRVAPVSAMSRDPAQRLQLIEQLSGIGMLPKEKYLELLGMPDLDGLLEQETGEQRWVERLVDRYMDAEDDKDLEKAGGFREPDGYLVNPMGALALVGQHYFDAMVNDVPEYNANLLRRFMSSLSRIIQKTMAAKIAPPAAVPGAGVAPVAAGQAAMPQMAA